MEKEDRFRFVQIPGRTPGQTVDAELRRLLERRSAALNKSVGARPQVRFPPHTPEDVGMVLVAPRPVKEGEKRRVRRMPKTRGALKGDDKRQGNPSNIKEVSV